MSNKIVMSKGSWGDWDCVIESDNGKGDFSTIPVKREKSINLDREDLLLAALKKLGIEVEFRTHWYKTVTDDKGFERGERVDNVMSNMD